MATGVPCAGWPGCVAVLLVAPLVFWAPEGLAAREARRPHFVRRRASKPARALRSLRRPPHQWGLVCWRVVGRVASLSGQAPPPPAGTAAGESRETVITFAGVCSVSGETDDTIASQIHLFSAQFWRAKASWVSWRRTEAPAMVLTVSSCGAVSSMGATKFAQRRLSMAIARDYSPSAGKMAQIRRFMACWASFITELPRGGVCRASFVPDMPEEGVLGEFCRRLRHCNQSLKLPPALRPGRSMRACPPDRRNRPRTRIGYCDMDRL